MCLVRVTYDVRNGMPREDTGFSARGPEGRFKDKTLLRVYDCHLPTFQTRREPFRRAGMTGIEEGVQQTLQSSVPIQCQNVE
uniref:Uncharacterized protein n=1 Tax=Romanomermis culicivorax TaxID=13658 RepID=A0A915K6A2_ROMCU